MKLKDTQAQLSLFMQKDIDITYYKEELGNLKSNISMLEDNIITLNNQNERLKSLIKQREQ